MSQVTNLLLQYQKLYEKQVDSINRIWLAEVIKNLSSVECNVYQWYIILIDNPIVRINEEFDRQNIPYPSGILLPQVFIKTLNHEIVDYQMWNIDPPPVGHVVYFTTTSNTSTLDQTNK